MRIAAPSIPDLTQFARIPLALTELPRWVLWKYVDRDGRPTKEPFQASGAHAASTNPLTWTDYATALKAYADHPDQFSGIGIVLGKLEDGRWLCGVDLDDCIVDGVPLRYARKIIDEFSTYTEISPSATGVKLFLFADKPLPPTTKDGGTGRRKFLANEHHAGDIEMYSEDRFFTVTGARLEVGT